LLHDFIFFYFLLNFVNVFFLLIIITMLFLFISNMMFEIRNNSMSLFYFLIFIFLNILFFFIIRRLFSRFRFFLSVISSTMNHILYSISVRRMSKIISIWCIFIRNNFMFWVISLLIIHNISMRKFLSWNMMLSIRDSSLIMNSSVLTMINFFFLFFFFNFSWIWNIFFRFP